MKCRATSVLLSLLCAPAPAQSPVTAYSGPVLSLRQMLVARARKLTLFPTFRWLAGRGSMHGLPEPEATQVREVLGWLRFGGRDPAPALALLDHKDPKVRTLAAAYAFASGDPTVLPKLYPLAKDQAMTFARPSVAIGRTLGTPLRPIEQSPQTVGFIVRGMLGRAMSASGVVTSDRQSLEYSFAKYRQLHGKRPHCAGWVSMRMARATGGANPLRSDTRSLIWDAWHASNKLPAVDRELAKVALWQKYHLGSMVEEQHAIRAARRLGANRLMSVIRGKPPTDDSDLRPRAGNELWESVCRFIAAHATSILRHQDADEMLAHRHWIAAAELAPQRASIILRQGLEQPGTWQDIDQRHNILTTLWRLVGDAESEFVLDTCFAQPKSSADTPLAPALVERLTQRWQVGDRALLNRFLHDQRFDAVRWWSLLPIARAMNEISLAPLVPPDELRDLSHPLGAPQFGRDPAKDARDHPAATRRVLATLADWRNRLRSAAKRWHEQDKQR